MNEPAPECEERLYWHKRFNLAAWFFLALMFYGIFASSTPWSALVALAASIGFRIFDSVCQARHMIWHMKGGGNMHL